MSQMIETKDLTEEYLMELKELCKKSTNVVGWYAHSCGNGGEPGATVRGPYFRWLTVSGPCDPEKYGKYVADQVDDARFFAAAGNVLPALLELLDQKDAKIKELKADMVKILESPRK